MRQDCLDFCPGLWAADALARAEDLRLERGPEPGGARVVELEPVAGPAVGGECDADAPAFLLRTGEDVPTVVHHARRDASLDAQLADDDLERVERVRRTRET